MILEISTTDQSTMVRDLNETYYDTRWFAVYSKPRLETVAESNLRRQSYETYLPLIKQARRRRSTWREIVEPLFPRYLFIRMTPKQNTMSPIASTRGVSNLVRFGHQISPVPEGLVEQLRAAENPASGFHGCKKPIFTQGEKVRVLDGPLAEIEAIFDSTDGDTRVTILLDILGRAANRITLSRDSIGRA